MATKRRARSGPKVLFLDIETAPMLGYLWSLWQDSIALNQLESDWSILSFSAKWRGDPPSKIIYQDVSKQKDISNDLPLLKALWKLIDEADVVITQNGISFDKKKIFARFAIHGMKPPSPVKMVDTKVIAKRNFAFTSNRLEYLTDKLNKKYKKLKHEKFSGFELWRECMAGNKAAWAEMRKYNMYDVLALEELYEVLRPWDNSVNFALYTEDNEPLCGCGSSEFIRKGWAYTTAGKYQRYKCSECGAWSRGKANHFDEETRGKLHARTPQS